MLEIIKAGGILMIPIIGCSVVAFAIVVERFWTLAERRVIPRHLVAQVWQWTQGEELNVVRLRALRSGSPLGRVLATGILTRSKPFEVMRSAVEDSGRHVAHELERFLTTLGTIAAISPLLGLLGTVFGMIQVFNVITEVGAGDPTDLAGGIATALITTAAGLIVAIPSLIFYRYFGSRVNELVIKMEQEAMRLVEVLEGAKRDNGTTVTTP